MQLSRLLLLAGGAAMAFGFAATGAAARGPALVVYQEDHFGGDSRAINDDQPDLGWIHFDDRISSVEVHRGVWEMCTDSRYRGRCITVDHDVGRLDRLGFDDRISSIHRLR